MHMGCCYKIQYSNATLKAQGLWKDTIDTVFDKLLVQNVLRGNGEPQRGNSLIGTWQYNLAIYINENI